MSATPPVILPNSGPGPSNGAGCSRWAGLGCTVVIIVLAALILGSFLFFDRGVQWAVRRAAYRIEQRLAPDVPAQLRDRLHHDLESFTARSGEPGAAPRNGVFLERAGRILEDGRVTRDEAEGLEAVLAASGDSTEERSGSHAP